MPIRCLLLHVHVCTLDFWRQWHSGDSRGTTCICMFMLQLLCLDRFKGCWFWSGGNDHGRSRGIHTVIIQKDTNTLYLVSRQCIAHIHDTETHDQFLPRKLVLARMAIEGSGYVRLLNRLLHSSLSSEGLMPGQKRLLELDVRSILETYSVASVQPAARLNKDSYNKQVNVYRFFSCST